MTDHDRKARKLRHARNTGRLLFGVFGVLAVVGNVLAAPDVPVWQALHALPPIAFMTTVEMVILFAGDLPVAWSRAVAVAVVFIIGASFALSYASLYHVARASGMGDLSWLFPILFEVAALTFSAFGIGASHALMDVERERRDAERAAHEAEERSETARLREEDKRRQRESDAAREALKPAPAPPQAVLDAIELRAQYGDTLPSQRALCEALGWSKGKVSNAVKEYRALPVEPAVSMPA